MHRSGGGSETDGAIGALLDACRFVELEALSGSLRGADVGDEIGKILGAHGGCETFRHQRTPGGRQLHEVSALR